MASKVQAGLKQCVHAVERGNWHAFADALGRPALGPNLKCNTHASQVPLGVARDHVQASE